MGMNGKRKDDEKHYKGFKTNIQVALMEEELRLLKIEMKDRTKSEEVILRPVEYLKYMEGIREKLRK